MYAFGGSLWKRRQAAGLCVSRTVPLLPHLGMALSSLLPGLECKIVQYSSRVRCFNVVNNKSLHRSLTLMDERLLVPLPEGASKHSHLALHGVTPVLLIIAVSLIQSWTRVNVLIPKAFDNFALIIVIFRSFSVMRDDAVDCG